jgi:DNA adenine methylase
MKPFVKWAGGKRHISQYILSYIRRDLRPQNTYYEPFVGGGGIFFTLQRPNCYINDLNLELIDCYRVIRDQHEELIDLLQKYKEQNSREFFEHLRSLDRSPKDYDNLSRVQKAARTIYINKTCFNGLYRVNSQGYFNVPYGKYKNPNICDEANIREIHDFLSDKSNNIKITRSDYKLCLDRAKEGDFIYFDPPYDYEDNKGFTAYLKYSFSEKDLIELKNISDDLIRRGCYVLISNNYTEKVVRFFDDGKYQITNGDQAQSYAKEKIDVTRYIGRSNGEKRKVVSEILIYGHK